jgi:hypothetical protein
MASCDIMKAAAIAGVDVSQMTDDRAILFPAGMEIAVCIRSDQPK